MKPASSILRDLLATRQFNKARLFQIDLVNGGSLFYTAADTDILFGGHTYSAGKSNGLLFEKSDNAAKIHWKIGVEVDTLTFDVIPNGATINGKPFLEAVKDGVFDGAEMTVSNVYWPQQTWQSPIVPTGAVTMFVGRVADISASRTIATFNVNSHLELLNQSMPRNLYQSGCINTLFDAGCTLNQASFAVNGSAASGSLTGTIYATLAQATGYFDLGKMQFTSGVNAGVWRSVKSHSLGSPSTIRLISPFPSAPAPGDAFTIYPGCDKTQATCSAKFSNAANFRGCRFIPENTTGV
jgi:uncharacterized phage protein (TIGR02218 family)